MTSAVCFHIGNHEAIFVRLVFSQPSACGMTQWAACMHNCGFRQIAAECLIQRLRVRIQREILTLQGKGS